MDIFPWKQGLGFAASEDWWRYVRSRTEPERLELLVMVALLNSQVAVRLLAHDPALLEGFALSDPAQQRLLAIAAPTLEDFVQQTLAEE